MVSKKIKRNTRNPPFSKKTTFRYMKNAPFCVTRFTLVEYTKLASIQLVILFCCSLGVLGLCPVFLSYPARWNGMNLSPLHSSSYISSHLSIGILCISIGQPDSLAIRISAETTYNIKKLFGFF